MGNTQFTSVCWISCIVNRWIIFCDLNWGTTLATVNVFTAPLGTTCCWVYPWSTYGIERDWEELSLTYYLSIYRGNSWLHVCIYIVWHRKIYCVTSTWTESTSIFVKVLSFFFICYRLHKNFANKQQQFTSSRFSRFSRREQITDVVGKTFIDVPVVLECSV